jgi:hypothetical protein
MHDDLDVDLLAGLRAREQRPSLRHAGWPSLLQAEARWLRAAWSQPVLRFGEYG